MKARGIRTLLLGSLLFAALSSRAAEPVPRMSKTSAWLLSQTIPGLTELVTPRGSSFAFEWEAAPLVYSFGMTRLVSPWHAFVVTPTERFSGSIEIVTTGMLCTSRIDGAALGASVQVLGHVPLVERGEHLGGNLGAAEYWYGTTRALYVIGGVSTLFGMLHFDLRYSVAQHAWMGALEVRIF